MSEKITCDFCGFEANKKESLKVNLGPDENNKDIEYHICSKECARAEMLDMKLFQLNEHMEKLTNGVTEAVLKYIN